MTWYGKELKRMRDRDGVTQDDLSAMTGIGVSTIRDVEKDRHGTSVTVLEKLLEPFECELEIMERNPA